MTEAASALAKGDFAQARALFGKAIEEDPENVEWKSGYYSAGFWDNRSPNLQKHKPGRAQAAFLLKEWDEFEILATDRNFESTESFRACMEGVFSLAADNLRSAFHEEGVSSTDTRLLLDLSECLIRIDDYENASDILVYARKLNPNNSEIIFKLADVYSLGGAESYARGLGTFRDGFLLDAKQFDPVVIRSEPIRSLYDRLLAELENREKTCERLPSELMARSIIPGLRKLGQEERKFIEQEVNRLQRDVQIVVEKFRARTKNLLLFYVLVLLQQYHFGQEKYSAGIGELEDILVSLDPGLFSIYKKTLAGN